MSAVVLRCSNCGTTQSVRGECEACHEAQVRFYCTNHSPGRWLDGQVCAQCGAVYGRSEPTPRRAKPTPPSRPEIPKSVEGPTSSRTSDWRKPRGPWGRRDPPPHSGEDYVTDEAIARAKALERLRELIGGVYSRRRAPMDVDMPSYSAGSMIAGGCLRVMVIIFLMLTLSYCTLSFLGSGLMFYF